MAIFFKDFKIKLFEFLPLILIFFISLNGVSVMDFDLFSINLHYIIIYFWTLRYPSALGYGFIFLSGIIADVVIGFPIGLTALTLLIVSGVAAYVRLVTVRLSLINDWISFIPALLIANLVNFTVLNFFDYSINYLYMFNNSIFTFIFYPVLWSIFLLIRNLLNS